MNCNTLKLENGNYVLETRYPWDTFPGPIVWRVESWTRQSIRLHRTYPVDQVFAGQMAPDGAHLVNVTINGAPTSGLQIAWGSALASVYGSNAERDAARRGAALPLASSQAPPAPAPAPSSSVAAISNFDSTPKTDAELFALACPNGPTSGAGIDPDATWKEGRRLASITGDGLAGTSLGHNLEVLVNYCKASAAGNGIADSDLGDMMYEGYIVNTLLPSGQFQTQHVPPNYRAAFYFYGLSAARGFTRGLIGQARMLAYGPQIKGSPIAQNGPEAFSLLERAGKAQDTDAMVDLVFLYTGRPLSWLSGVTLPNESPEARQAHANDYAKKATVILADSERICVEEINEFAQLVPGGSAGRSYAIFPTLVRNNPEFEIDCVMSLSAAPVPEHESMADQFSRVMAGGAINQWEFKLFQSADGRDAWIERESAAEAIEQAIQQVTNIFDAVRGQR